MQAREIFQAGVKTVGLFTVIYAIRQILGVVALLSAQQNNSDLVPGDFLYMYRFQIILQIIILFIIIAIGVYLLKGGRKIVRFAFPDLSAASHNDFLTAGRLFYFIIRLSGFAMIIYSIPLILQILVRVVYDKGLQHTGFAAAIHPVTWLHTFVYLIFGFYLLKGGKFFYHLAFPKEAEVD